MLEMSANMTEEEPLVQTINNSYSAIPSARKSSAPQREKGPLPDGGYITFLRIEGDKHGDLVPLHEITAWDAHFHGPFFHSMIAINDPCDGRDFGANERNFLAWARLAAAFTSTSFAFIINYYIPPGRSIFGDAKEKKYDPSLQNRGALAWGLIFLLFALGTMIYAYYCYVYHMLHVGRRSLLVQFSWHTLVFFGLSCLAMFIAAFYMMAGGLIEQRRMMMCF
ncbi:uncharacterized protein V1516DRAFT_668394 [Lipomyces oligophaga]|uniref:uncharacterized protein n=1 Tax=Lipomyces oligophaga TaxID=45792 RepID=UPI0034CEE137